MGILAKPLGYVLTWLYHVIGNYGLALIILTVVIKLLLYPLYKKQIMSTSNMSAIQPKVKEIQNKYANDKNTMNEKLSELYKEEGVSVNGGCLPMIVQMVVIIGLFTLLRNPIAYVGTDEMMFAVHSSFLWIQDMAQPDKWILPIISGVATFLATFFSQSQMAAGPNADSMKIMNYMMKYFFPVMILLLARSYPAGLAVYWAGSQIIQIFYNIRFAQLRKERESGKSKKKKKKIA